MTRKKANIKMTTDPSHPGSRYLFDHFERKKKINSKYSLRGFANYLGVDHSQLSKVLRGETVFSRQVYIRILGKLNAPKDILREIMQIDHREIFFEDMSDDQFEILSNWVHFAILELMTIEDFVIEPKSISSKLGISSNEAKQCIERLKRQGFIAMKSGKYLALKPNNNWYFSDKTTESKKKFQELLLERSKEAIRNTDITERDHSSVILALNAGEISAFKEWLKEARDQLTKVIQKKKPYNEIYCLQMSFFPLSRQSSAE